MRQPGQQVSQLDDFTVHGGSGSQFCDRQRGVRVETPLAPHRPRNELSHRRWATPQVPYLESVGWVEWRYHRRRAQDIAGRCRRSRPRPSRPNNRPIRIALSGPGRPGAAESPPRRGGCRPTRATMTATGAVAAQDRPRAWLIAAHRRSPPAVRGTGDHPSREPGTVGVRLCEALPPCSGDPRSPRACSWPCRSSCGRPRPASRRPRRGRAPRSPRTG